ncbi:hypothetical protein RD792_004520 [Penstemon davidsonii]|uniref:Bidirectional sugar transporter SWEET n=1 Tax=Penstemon davidsonii TaxID=160366 RepID=A0ABR0DHN5_9LAMI|nr:hypothetical protein RD792_004520 [Penstemon davidsonii]
MEIFFNAGNIVSILVYLAPLPTFIRIYKEKSTMGFDSLPYVVALFSAMLWMYYAFLKTNAVLLISINSFGCIIETVYIFMFLFYASKKVKTHTFKLLGLMNVGLFSLIFMLTFFIFGGQLRTQIVGWICVAISVCVFVAPLSIVVRIIIIIYSKIGKNELGYGPGRLDMGGTQLLRIEKILDRRFQVVRTRSVEFMPFTLSFFLTLSAVMWFSYGLFQRDICIALPNVMGFFLGMLQMLLYGIYRNAKVPEIDEEKKIAEQVINNNIMMLGTPEVHPVDHNSHKIKEENNKDDEEEANINRGISCVPCAISVEPSQVNNLQLESPVLIVCAA